MSGSDSADGGFLRSLGLYFAGIFLGCLFFLVLVAVPMAGVRRGLTNLFLNWQEFGLVASALLTGALSGALVMRRRLFLEDNLHASTVKIEALKEEEEPLTNLVAGSKRFRLSFTGRTRLLFLFVYLLLYVNLSVLCLYLRLGIFDFPDFNSVLRSLGLGLSLIGFYILLRSLKSARTIACLAESSYYEAEVGLLAGEEASESKIAPVPGHIPPVRKGFLKEHPLCTGWLYFMVGMPLIFQAWFPLLAIPGVYIALNWLYAKEGK